MCISPDSMENSVNPLLSATYIFLYVSIPLHSDFVTLNVKEGTSIELDCQLSGLKDENYVKWLKDGTEVAYETVANSSQKLRFDVDSEDYKLTISHLSPADDGTYDCAMLNERREFIIKSKRRFKLVVQGWCNSFNSRYHVLSSNRNQADAHVLLAQNSLSQII
jgi:hypothetical protein